MFLKAFGYRICPNPLRPVFLAETRGFSIGKRGVYEGNKGYFFRFCVNLQEKISCK